MAAPAAVLRPAVDHGRREASAGGLIWWLAGTSLVLAASVMFSRYLVTDSFYDLYAGRYILANGIPHLNVATVVAHGTAWTDQQWLAQVLYYLAWLVGGYRLLAAVSAVLVTSGFAVFAALMIRRRIPPTRAFAWTLVAFTVCIGNTGIRAQSFAYPLLAVTLWLILDDETAALPRTRTWLLVPLLMFWANAHGSVLLGAGLVAGYSGYRAVRGLVQRDRKCVVAYLALAGCSALSVVCTPYGVGVLNYYLRFASDPVLRHSVLEWAPPSPLRPVSWAFFAAAGLIVGSLVVAWRRGARPNPLLAAFAAISLALALTATRNQAWFGFCGSLLAADTLARASGARVPALSRGFRIGVLGALGLLALTSLAILAVTSDRQFYSQTPIQAIGAAARAAGHDPAVRVLGDDVSGTAMLWLDPALFGRVGFDVRFEQYTPAELGAYVDFIVVRGPAWQRIARGYAIIVASKRHPRLVRALARLPGWRVSYDGATGVVVTRQLR